MIARLRYYLTWPGAVWRALCKVWRQQDEVAPAWQGVPALELPPPDLRRQLSPDREGLTVRFEIQAEAGPVHGYYTINTFEDGTLDDFDTSAKQVRREARERDAAAREDWIRTVVDEALADALTRRVEVVSVERHQWADGPKGINADVTLDTPSGTWSPLSSIKAWENVGSPWDDVVGERSDEDIAATAILRYRRSVVDEAVRAAGLHSHEVAEFDIASSLRR